VFTSVTRHTYTFTTSSCKSNTTLHFVVEFSSVYCLYCSLRIENNCAVISYGMQLVEDRGIINLREGFPCATGISLRRTLDFFPRIIRC
jgi:hypothetical protein